MEYGWRREPTGRTDRPSALRVTARRSPATSISRVNARVNFCMAEASSPNSHNKDCNDGSALKASYRSEPGVDRHARPEYNGGWWTGPFPTGGSDANDSGVDVGGVGGPG